MGRTPGSKNVRGLGANGYGGVGRKTLITNGRKGPGSGRSNLASSNGVHSKMNGTKGSHGSMKNREHEDSEGGSIPTEPPVDYTNQVNFPYEVRLNGYSTLLETMKNGTPSVRKMVMDECDIIMECRICRSLFRSLPNFLKHKKSFCTEKFQKISPGGLSHLMKLAAESFKINGGTKLSFSPPVRTMPDIASDTSSGESGGEASRIQLRYQTDGPSGGEASTIQLRYQTDGPKDDPSFDLNNVIPMLTRATREKSNGLRVDELLKTTQHEFRTSELKLLDNTTHYQGYSRNRKVDFQDYVSTIQGGAHAKRIMHDTVLLGPDAEIACAADPDVIGDIIQRLLAKVEEKHVEQEVKQQTLKCSICHTWYETEKSLRMHVRTHAVVHERPPKKRKSAPATATADSETTEEESKAVIVKAEPEVEKQPDPGPPKLKEMSTTPMNSPSLSKEQVQEPSVPPNPPKPVATTSSKSGQVQNTLKSKAKPKQVPEPPILYSNGSVPIKGRRTNNSFSATLNSASLSSLLPTLTPVTPTIPSRSTKTSDSQPTQDSNSKSVRTRGRRKSVNKTPETEILTCMKCDASFRSKSEMSMHLAWCTGVINFSLSTSHGLSSTPKISILDRQEYHKTPPVLTKNLPTTSSHVGSSSKTSPVENHLNNDERDNDTISIYTVSSDEQDPEKINEEIESYLEEAGASKKSAVPVTDDDDDDWGEPYAYISSPESDWNDPQEISTDDSKTSSNVPPANEAPSGSDNGQRGRSTSAHEPMDTGKEDEVTKVKVNVPNSSGAIAKESVETEKQYSDTPPVLDQ